MATYSNKHPMMSEANTEAYDPHFSLFYPGSYSNTPQTNFNPLHGNPEAGLYVTPLRTIAPQTESAPSDASVSKSPKSNKRKDLKMTGELNQPKKKPITSEKAKEAFVPEVKREKKNPNIDINMDRVCFDFSGVLSPVCTCTGVARVCYKWGTEWQSSCCTISVSEYPLPMNTTRPGARLAGRKMSYGAYLKLLTKFAAEGYVLSQPVDLKNHWARQGTNKFVTIK